MKIASVLALSGWLAMAGTVSAEQREGAPGGFTPTPGMITMMSLGQSGLLGSMFSNEVYGNTQNKMGQSRATIGYIEDSLIRQGVPEAMWPAFKDRGTTFVMPMALIKELPSASGASCRRRRAACRSNCPAREIALPAGGRCASTIASLPMSRCMTAPGSGSTPSSPDRPSSSSPTPPSSCRRAMRRAAPQPANSS